MKDGIVRVAIPLQSFSQSIKVGDELICIYEPPLPLGFGEWLRLPLAEKLKRICFFYLRKTGAIKKRSQTQTVFNYREVEINLRQVAQEAESCLLEYRAQNGEYPDILFVGREIERELILELRRDYYNHGTVLGSFDMSGGSFQGAKLIVTPRLKGMFAASSKKLGLKD